LGQSERLKVMDRLHAYSYYLEALLPVVGREECRAALENGIERTASLLRALAPEFVRSDVYAQLLRIRVLAGDCGAVPLNESAAREEAAAIPAFQMESPDVREDGGFCFGRRAGALLPYVNPVSTAFCLQALEYYRQHAEGELGDDWRAMI
jgi:hypothetical protein